MAKLFKLNENLDTNNNPYFRSDKGTFDTDSYEVSQLGNFHAPAGFQDIGGVEVLAGHQLCIFSDYNQRNGPISNVCLDEGRHSLPKLSNRWPKHTRSYQLIKNCDHPVNMWDPDCNTLIDSKKVMSPCSIPRNKCYENKVSYCNSLSPKKGGADVERCAEFCRGKSGVCDNFMLAYCKIGENQDKKICKCINSPVNQSFENKIASIDRNVKYNPLCIDAECIRDGYATTVMTDNRCPNLVDCGVYHDIESKGVKTQFIDSKIAQRCSPGAFLKGATTESDVKGQNITTESSLTKLVVKTKSYLGVKMVFLVTVVLIAIVLFVYRTNVYRVCRSMGGAACYGLTGIIAVIGGLVGLWVLTLQGKTTVHRVSDQPIEQAEIPITGKLFGACTGSNDCDQPLKCYSTDHYVEKGEIKGRCMSETDCKDEGGKTCSPL